MNSAGCAAERLVASLKLAHYAATLGGVSTLVVHPAAIWSRHHGIQASEEVEMGISSEVRSALGEMPDQLERVFRLFPTAYLNWTPESWEGIPGESFSAIGQACHLRDIEIDGYYVRIKRVLAEEQPSLVSLDGYELAKLRHYGAANPAEVIAAFRQARETTSQLIKTISDRQLDRPATFGEYGRITLKGMIYLLCSHDQRHLACMHWLLAKIESLNAGYCLPLPDHPHSSS